MIWCAPYECSLSAESCARRHVRSLGVPAGSLEANRLRLCMACKPGAKRARKLGLDVVKIDPRRTK